MGEFILTFGWIIFAGIVVALLILNFFIVRYFDDKRKSEFFPTVVAVAALTLTLLCTLLVPLDIYSVSSQQGLEMRQGIQTLYLVLYCCVLAFAFGVIPFACFYYEAYDPEADSPLLKRFWDGFKYTIGLLIIVIVLLVVGLFLQSPSQFNGDDPPDVWAKKLIGEGKGLHTISFTVACITLVGYIIWCTYTVYGLASFPISLIKGQRSIREEIDEVKDQISTTRAHKDTVQDRESLLRSEDKERALTRRAQRLQSAQTCCRKMLVVLRPFSIVFGAILVIVSLGIVVSLGLTALDRTLHHIPCDATCGFILQHPEIFNPLDKLLIVLGSVFPVDYVVICLLVLYIYFVTLHSITEIGIRFFCLNMFQFRKGRTQPQGLMTASVILMLSILALNNSLVTLAPTYSLFGSQTWQPNGTETAIHCSMNAPQESGCIMTQLGTIVNGVNLSVGFFGIAFYGFTWLFTLAFFISLVIAGCRARQSVVDAYSDDDEEDER